MYLREGRYRLRLAQQAVTAVLSPPRAGSRSFCDISVNVKAGGPEYTVVCRSLHPARTLSNTASLTADKREGKQN